jgi:hypothetical protein
VSEGRKVIRKSPGFWNVTRMRRDYRRSAAILKAFSTDMRQGTGPGGPVGGRGLT